MKVKLLGGDFDGQEIEFDYEAEKYLMMSVREGDNKIIGPDDPITAESLGMWIWESTYQSEEDPHEARLVKEEKRLLHSPLF